MMLDTSKRVFMGFASRRRDVDVVAVRRFKSRLPRRAIQAPSEQLVGEQRATGAGLAGRVTIQI
jgi:hypothetical protein